MERGTQIAYVPSHAKGNLKHADVEFGFVTSERGKDCFCRFWRKGKPGELRTVCCSELTPTDCLVKVDILPQERVDELFDLL